MRALFLEVDPKWLEERRRLGHDRFDEVWDGVYHVVPGPSTTHHRFERELEHTLTPIAKRHGFEIFRNCDLLDRSKGDDNYRQPDLAIVSPADVVERGINGHAELVVEILSPHDTSREKFDFYAMCNIPEYWIVDPKTRAIEVYVLRLGTYVLVTPDANGVIQAPRFSLVLSVIDGPKLRIAWADGSAEV